MLDVLLNGIDAQAIHLLDPEDIMTETLSWFYNQRFRAENLRLPIMGFRLLYVYQPSTGNHAYLNLDTDIILSDAEAMHALGVTE